MPTKAIAKKLGISYRTINWHLRNLCVRYSARNSVHLMYLLHPSGNSHLLEFHGLTLHENSILHMIMRGSSIEDIAYAKGIRLTTAKLLHREHIREKTGSASIREAAALILGLNAKP